VAGDQREVGQSESGGCIGVTTDNAQSSRSRPLGPDLRTTALDELFRERTPGLLRTAYLLTGDRALAQRLLEKALGRAYTQWSKLRDVVVGERFVRRHMVALYAARWRGRQWSVDRGGSEPSDDLTVLRSALDGLSRRERAMVVLRFYDEMTEHDVAEALGTSASVVHTTVARALARLRNEAGPLTAPVTHSMPTVQGKQ
jgi:DNA-directed RNA polymerase specialized sigma24 family protein